AGFVGAGCAGETRRGASPAPQVFRVAAAGLHAAPARCLVIEDAPAGVQAARAGGMKCVGVTFVGHHPDDALRAAGADLVVRTLEEVNAATVKDLLRANSR